jgi:Dyp-type peroxidase family
MRRELIIKTRSLAGASDLTLLAPIKRGLVPALESLTYKTRVKRLLRTLTSLRAGSHEYALLRPLSDAVERVGRIHSVRVAVIEPEDKVLLAVTFDGAWEAYIRVLWQKVGGLLDVIFCNTEGYVSACDHSFAEYLDWAKRIQSESAFFYAAPHTVDDVPYLRREELLHRMTDDALKQLYQSVDRDLLATRLHTSGAEADAAAQRTTPAQIGETVLQAMTALGGFYRLADAFLPSEEDGKHLQRAARELLMEFRGILAHSPDTLALLQKKFAPQIAWLQALDGVAPVRPKPVLAAPHYDKANVQGGIVTAYERVTHGCLMLMTFDNAAAGASLLEKILPQITCDDVQPTKEKPIVTNVALTHEGFRTLGLSEAQLEYFSQGFREGMEARAGLLGDVRTNHPRRWRLPTRVEARGATQHGALIELSSVHILVQLRIRASTDNDADDPLQPNHPLYDRVKEIASFDPSARLLAVQSMRRSIEVVEGKDKVREHFGFLDGDGQPVIGPQQGTPIYMNGVHLGEILLGYSNEADPAPEPSTEPSELDRRELLFDGSFLVVRKLRQDVAALHAKATIAARTSGLAKDTVLAKLMGRELDGKPLATKVGSSDNDFDFHDDPVGSACPFHAHIRRANPRERIDARAPPGGRRPRIMRRGMSYGPRYDHDNPGCPGNAAERGLMFMAYNSSIEEQFEVVQRWLCGGNSSGGLSQHSDPLLGVPENGQQRFYRFEHAGKVVRMGLDGSPTFLADPQPFVRLEWGLYLFAPSLRALRKLKQIAATVKSTAPVWSVDDGERQIAALQAIEAAGDEHTAIEAWKSALEDPDAVEDFASASIWAAIRARHGGVLRTPYGVLVGDRALVMQVFTDAQGRYTARGYHQRMARSIGEIYLGLDRPPGGGQYDVESAATNNAIRKLDEEAAFNRAFRLTRVVLDEMFGAQRLAAQKQSEPQWSLALDVKQISDIVLAKLCQYWFGIPKDESVFATGGSRWDWNAGDKPLCPGNFTAPSRYIFQPRPGDTVEAYGALYGRTLTEAMRIFIEQYSRNRQVPPDPDGAPAPIAADILEAHWQNASSVTQVARDLVGAMMGLLPTVDGNLRRSLNEWLNDQTFWCLRARWPAAPGATDFAKASSLLRPALMRSMQLRPSPELVWRTVSRHHTIGPVAVAPGDLIVLSIVSATQQCLQHQIADVFPIFGGDRSKPEHPTHACPGYKAAMGVLLGIIAALLDVAESVRPTPAPLVLQFSGPAKTPSGS